MSPRDKHDYSEDMFADTRMSFGEHLEELRRHPLVGVLPAETEPELRPLTSELNHLLADLRARLHETEKRSADIEGFAAGPPDLALIGTDADWGVTFFSRGAVSLLGWAPEEVAGRHVEALFAEGEWDRVLPKLARRSLREAGFSETIRMQRRDRTVFTAQVSIAGAAGDGSSMLLAARDLTSDQELHARLLDSEERYRSLVEGMGDGVFILQDDRIVYANAALARMDEGTFGTCETCHDSVEKERLLSDPLIRFCLDHLTHEEQRALESDLELAARIQKGLLPPPEMSAAGWQVRYHYEPLGPVSGDYCDVLESDSGLLFLFGDVSGKGVAASMLMSHLHATFRSLARVQSKLPSAPCDRQPCGSCIDKKREGDNEPVDQ